MVALKRRARKKREQEIEDLECESMARCGNSKFSGHGVENLKIKCFGEQRKGFTHSV